MADFFDMGGYAVFVWTSYGLTVVSLGVLAIGSLRGVKTTREKVESLRPRRRKEG